MSTKQFGEGFNCSLYKRFIIIAFNVVARTYRTLCNRWTKLRCLTYDLLKETFTLPACNYNIQNSMRE